MQYGNHIIMKKGVKNAVVVNIEMKHLILIYCKVFNFASDKHIWKLN